MLKMEEIILGLERPAKSLTSSNGFFKTAEKNLNSLDLEIAERSLELKHNEIPLWYERWFLSSNAKDIGTLYLIFALFSGLLGTAFSVLIRLELSGPGVQYIADNQLYNSIITAHAILMIFFMVKLNASGARLRMLNNKLNISSIAFCRDYSTNSIVKDCNVIIGNDNNDNKPSLLRSLSYAGDQAQTSEASSPQCGKKQDKYVKVLVEDPYNNRGIILRMTKKQKGVYVWETIDGSSMYVGHSINLYNRISTYFMPSILNTKARIVLRYLNKHGFNNIKLTIYIMDIESSLDQVVALEQSLIDSFKPNLNVDLVASGSGYHEPMSHEIRNKLFKERGTPIYLYNHETLNLLHVFESKQHMYNSIGIHHKTLGDCLDLGTLYLDYFFLSLDLLETVSTNLLTLDELKSLVISKRDLNRLEHPAAKGILAEFKDDSSKNLQFGSLNSLARHLKGDRQVIRDYLKGTRPGYYRGKWKFTYHNFDV
jgi:hypothetical protein